MKRLAGLTGTEIHSCRETHGGNEAKCRSLRHGAGARAMQPDERQPEQPRDRRRKATWSAEGRLYGSASQVEGARATAGRL